MYHRRLKLRNGGGYARAVNLGPSMFFCNIFENEWIGCKFWLQAPNYIQFHT